MSRSRIALFLLLAAGCSGCYTPQYLKTVRVFGDFDPARDLRLAEKAESLPWNDARTDIRVVGGRMPAGISLSEESRLLTIDEAASSRYTVIGSAVSTVPASGYTALYWYYPMHDREGSFRPAFCSWQAPLRAVTFGLWSLFVPLNYACLVDESPDGQVHLRELKRMAAAMGGNLVVVASVTDVVAHGEDAATGNYLDSVQVHAYVLLDRTPGAAEEAPDEVTPPSDGVEATTLTRLSRE